MSARLTVAMQLLLQMLTKIITTFETTTLESKCIPSYTKKRVLILVFSIISLIYLNSIFLLICGSFHTFQDPQFEIRSTPKGPRNNMKFCRMEPASKRMFSPPVPICQILLKAFKFQKIIVKCSVISMQSSFHSKFRCTCLSSYF